MPSDERQGVPRVSSARRLEIALGPVAAHLDVVLNGVVKDGQLTAMVPWKNTLSNTDIAAS